LGFAATDFMITITLSAADASAHAIENPFAPDFLHGQEVAITLGLIAGLGIVFLRGFKEAINVAVVLVAVFLLLNAVVVLVGLAHVYSEAHVVTDWWAALNQQHGNPNSPWGSPVSKRVWPSCRRSRAARTTPRRSRPAGSAARTSS
jgi:hypothetical protein